MANIENPRPLLRCQYWKVKEPSICIYWDATSSLCTYEEVTIINDLSVVKRGDLYPLCNYIGTAATLCTKYTAGTSEGEEIVEEFMPRCVLPDPYRHVYRTPNCGKWIIPKVEDGMTVPLDFSPITGYNDGNCNFSESDDTTGGTDSTCSGYTPGHLGFSARPIIESCTINGTPLVDTSQGTPRLPMSYSILNKRAELGKCKWWDSDITEFSLVAATNNAPARIEAPEFKCTNGAAIIQEFATFYEDTVDKYVRPPCNGAMPDCPKYTGNLATSGYLPFLSSVFIRHGDKIMAEQVLELRYNIKKENWNPEEYNLLFGDSVSIFANTGVSPEIVVDSTGNILDYSLQAIKVSIADFRCLTFERLPTLLTKGTPADDGRTDFPTLIKDVGELPLSPIIHSTFDTPWDINDNTLSFAQKTEYVYETPYTDHKDLLIVGEHFSASGKQNDIFAINLSDPDMYFPFPELFNFADMYAYKYSLSAGFDEKHAQLVSYFKILKDIDPARFYYNTFTEDNRAFMISVRTFFGENKIMVFDTSRTVYSFSNIILNKHYCGGVIAQTGFSVSTSDAETSDFIDYEFLNGHPLFNPELSYTFKALYETDGSRAIPYSTYLDTKIVHLKAPLDMSTNNHYVVGYRMYKIKILSNFFVDTCDTTTYSRIIFLGNDGHVLVVIDDGYKLHSIIRNWDTGDLDESGNSKPMKLFLSGEDSLGVTKSIEMSIVEYCSDRLEVNQLILKPKYPNEYVRLYRCNISFGDIFVYERYSFGQLPDGDYEEIRDGWSEEDIVSRADTSLIGSIESNNFTVKNPPIAPIIASVIYKGGITLRIKGQAKTDLMNWVKQPFCSDVEIKYSWSASYRSYTLLPTHYCFVEDIGVSYTEPGKGGEPSYPIRGYTPYCGDHGFGRISTRPAPMWYPYNSCDSYASYNIYAGSGENDPAPMDFWVNATGKYTPSDKHNEEDLRMLGPASNFGITTDVHTTIWACGCDWTHMNLEMLGAPWFSGWARIRSGVEGEALFLMTQNGGKPPKFGNKKRGYLSSFRSTAYLTYYEISAEGDIAVKYKWLPPYEGFTDLRLDKSYAEYPWKHYFNTTDNISTYMSQFGLLSAQSVDGISISEALVKTGTDAKDLARFRFTEIFKAHFTTTGMRYPEPRKAYYKGLAQTPITAWLTYKDVPLSAEAEGSAIQWAWREVWQPLERGKPDIRATLTDFSEDSVKSYNMGFLSFFGFNYPNYTYDYMISEFRRVSTEGDHVINWLPSTYDPDNPLPTHFLLWLDDGPRRVLDPRHNIITNAADIDQDLQFEGHSIDDLLLHTRFYKECSGGSWLNNITSDFDLEDFTEQIKDLTDVNSSDNFMLYTSNTIPVETESLAKANAEDDKRTILTLDDFGEETKYYFNRGIVLDIKQGMTQYVPRKEILLNIDYEFSLSIPANDDSQYSTIIPLEFYPAFQEFGMIYNSLINYSVNLVFKFSSPVIIGKVEVIYFKGETVEDADLNLKTYYNVPDTTLAKSVDGQMYTDVLSDGYEFGAPGVLPESFTKTYDIDDSDPEYMSELYSFFSMTFNYKPSKEDLEAKGLEYSITHTHMMDIRVIRLYTVEYTSLTENITTHERKYNISVGAYGDIPVHGFESVGSLLYPDPWSLSTIYQMDNALGMVGAPGWVGTFNTVSKLRGRKAQQLRTDPEVLSGDYSDFEGKQKELYDEVALDGEEVITMHSVAKDILSAVVKKTNVKVFPEWACVLENKNMTPLKSIVTKSKYYPQGHRWTWGLDNVNDFFNCGGGGVRRWKTLFSYKWGRVTGIYGYGYDTDAVFDLYSYAVSKQLTNWANYAWTREY